VRRADRLQAVAQSKGAPARGPRCPSGVANSLALATRSNVPRRPTWPTPSSRTDSRRTMPTYGARLQDRGVAALPDAITTIERTYYRRQRPTVTRKPLTRLPRAQRGVGQAVLNGTSLPCGSCCVWRCGGANFPSNDNRTSKFAAPRKRQLPCLPGGLAHAGNHTSRHAYRPPVQL
jgi:hypothetical protein